MSKTMTLPAGWSQKSIGGYICHIYPTGPLTFYCVMQKRTGTQRGKWIAMHQVLGRMPTFLDVDASTPEAGFYDSAEEAMAAVMEVHAENPIDSVLLTLRPDGFMEMHT